MEKIGLLNNLLSVMENNYQAHCTRSESREELFYRESIEQRYKALQEIGKANDITLFITVEKVILHDDLNRYANSSEEVNSIKTALLQLGECLQSFNIVKNKEYYQALNAGISSKNKEAGLPLDAFRMFIKSHIARLTNRLTGTLSVTEKNVLRQRKENLRTAKELYMDLQRKALKVS